MHAEGVDSGIFLLDHGESYNLYHREVPESTPVVMKTAEGSEVGAVANATSDQISGSATDALNPDISVLNGSDEKEKQIPKVRLTAEWTSQPGTIW